MEWAERRCECSGDNCSHHRGGARCKKGLRGDDWKIYWRRAEVGATRDNVRAWCLTCFGNNFDVPTEAVALLSSDIAGYALLLQEDRRRAITTRSVLRDAADRVANEHRGRVVGVRMDDDLLFEFKSCAHALDAARHLPSVFDEMSKRLGLPDSELCGAIHHGEVSRWRSGLLVGEAVRVVAGLKELAGSSQLILTEPAVQGLKSGQDALLPLEDPAAIEIEVTGKLYSVPLAG